MTRYGIELPCLPFMYGWLYVALYGIIWPFVALCGPIWFYCFCVFLYGLLWHSYGFQSHFMVFNGRISSFLAVIDPNSFGLVSDSSTKFLDLPDEKAS